MGSAPVYRKTDNRPGALAFEAAGLRHLARAHPRGGVAIAQVVELGEHHLATAYIPSGAASVSAARELGRRLAITHRELAGIGWAAPPAGHRGDGVMGRASLSLTGPGGSAHNWDSWGHMYAFERLLPYVEQARARGALSDDDARRARQFADRLASGVLDHDMPQGMSGPGTLIHGDLWSGNVLWSTQGPVLIDPAAHGGHPEEDLAQLATFGAPYLEEIYAAYNEVAPLASGWRERQGLHQICIIAVHAALFDGGYGRELMGLIHRYR